jgi:hypothetical protein
VPGFDDLALVGEPVDDGGAEPGVGEGLGPGTEWLIASHRNARPFFSLGENFEEQLSSATVEAEVAELVQDQQIDPAVTGA